MALDENNHETETETLGEDDPEALKTKLLATDTRLQLTATELKATQAELEVTRDELQTARMQHAALDASLVASVTAFARPTSPDGWLLCDGRAVSRTEYARLFAAIGTIYGEGDGTTTFNLPDMRGLFVRGHDPIGKQDSKREFASYQGDQIQSHSHADSGHSHSGSTGSAGDHSHSASTDSAGSHIHNGKSDRDGDHSHFMAIDEYGADWYVACFTKDIGRASLTYDSSVEGTLLGWKSPLGNAGSHYHILEIDSAGSHSHKINVNSAGSHSHSVSIGSGQANLSNPTNARHGGETRVKNIALIYCIKY